MNHHGRGNGTFPGMGRVRHPEGFGNDEVLALAGRDGKKAPAARPGPFMHESKGGPSYLISTIFRVAVSPAARRRAK